jgi:hypothetical protein
MLVDFSFVFEHSDPRQRDWWEKEEKKYMLICTVMNDHGDEMGYPKKIQYIRRHCAYI